MIRDRVIVCIASAWDGDPTSKHHIMRILARHNDVLWINYHGTRRPTLNRVDVRGSFETLGRVMRGVEPLADSMWQMTPFVIPGARRKWVARASQKLLARQIHTQSRRSEGRHTDPCRSGLSPRMFPISWGASTKSVSYTTAWTRSTNSSAWMRIA